MYIAACKISNYMAFYNSESIEFEPGFNIVIGRNNVGKTALLNALSLNIDDEPHRSVRSLPSPDDRVQKHSSSAIVTLNVTKDESHNYVVQSDGRWLLPEANSAVPGYLENRVQHYEQWRHRKPSNINLIYDVTGSSIKPSEFHSLSKFRPEFQSDGLPRYRLFREMEDSSFKSDGRPNMSLKATIEMKVLNEFRRSLFRFDAERPHIGRTAIGNATNLNSDASNLPQVLHILLTNNRHKFGRFEELVRRVLPSVKGISVKPLDGNEVEVRIWLADPSSEREELTVPLEKCGTGVGQVISMLYIVFMANTPHTIIIDEPQSFLHPSAVRELIEVFKEFPRHQYIVATHSPQVISAAHPCRIVQVYHDGHEANLSANSSSDVEAIFTAFNEVGLKPSDTFGADSLLWVEGPTEEICFRLILENKECIDKNKLREVQILPVCHTGDFQQKKKQNIDLVFGIYERVSKGGAFVPPAIGYIFDRENLSKEAQADLKRRAKPASLEFLERRMYENYLLHPSAIAHVLNDESYGEDAPDKAVSEEEISAWIDKWRSNGQSSNESGEDTEWIKTIDGSQLLHELFANFSEQVIDYTRNKRHYAEKMTSYLLEHSPDELSEIVQLLERMLDNDIAHQ